MMTHKIVVGLGFGDETKGATVDWLCAQQDVKAVIRFNGGPQAAHNVVTPEGLHHTFSQFGSGTFLGVPTHFSKHTMFNPFNLWPERTHLMEDCGLPDPLDNFTVAWGALLITPYHREMNRIREDARGVDGKRHGSTGQGIGEVRYLLREYPYMAPRVSDMTNPYVLRHMLNQIRDLYVARDNDMSGVLSPDELVQQYVEMNKHINVVPDNYIDSLLDSGDCVFEGAQGVLLDELYGFNPHTTFSKTTQENARDLLNGREAECWGASRVYHTRHGHGPFPTEDYAVTYDMAPELHNVYGHYQGGWRVGALDLALLRYAIFANGGIDKLVMSHMDYLPTDENARKKFEWTDGYVKTGDRGLTWLSPGETMGTPYNREQSHEWGPEMFKMKHVISDYLHDEEQIARTLKQRIGHEPYLYAYGPTREDRRLADVPAVSGLQAVG